MDRRNFLRASAKAFLAGSAVLTVPSLLAEADNITGTALPVKGVSALGAKPIAWSLVTLESDKDIGRQQIVVEAVIQLGEGAPQWALDHSAKQGVYARPGEFICSVHIPYGMVDELEQRHGKIFNVRDLFEKVVRERVDLDAQDMTNYSSAAAFWGSTA